MQKEGRVSLDGKSYIGLLKREQTVAKYTIIYTSLCWILLLKIRHMPFS